ncbi:MAG: sulfite exporter TauE/SafE family protein [Chlamydiae bacterium]|nr:sulfite exporter TauE/SafE family protein [Chlamydiota bacterium]
MEYLVICVSAFIISALTLFSGFGLGTVLMPVFALFFPLPIAIASTAGVHLLTNLFKFTLVGKFSVWKVIIRFGVPAAIASAIGAFLLSFFSNVPSIFSYTLHDNTYHLTVIGLTVGVIIIASSVLELVPKFSTFSFAAKYIPFGGFLSGFFGGISGNQGILRSAFLFKAGLTKEQFIGTGVVCSIIVDSVRVLVYSWATYTEQFAPISSDMLGILVAACLTAFLGAYVGSQLMTKVSYKMVQYLIGYMLLILGAVIAIGIA